MQSSHCPDKTRTRTSRSRSIERWPRTPLPTCPTSHEHELVKRHYVRPYICDMCWESLSGAAYGCRAGCDFAIHDACAAHPPTLDSPEHHPHQLVLVETSRDVSVEDHDCDVCIGRCTPGCFIYRCPPCNFDMHPRCARLPPAVRCGRHLEHDLALVFAEGRCDACQHDDGAGGGRAWFYRCDVCELDLHVSCAAGEGPEDAGAHGEGEGGDGDAAAGLLDEACDAELLRAKIVAQSHMASAVAMSSAAGWRIGNIIG